MIIGQEVVASINPLPRVSLFEGPRSVGKWTTAEWLRHTNKISDSDVFRVKRLLVEQAIAITRFAALKPTAGSRRLAIVNLDGATAPALNHLLKALEESPETSTFVLIASKPVLPTIKSRSAVFPFHVLSTDAVAEILETKKGFTQGQARIWAERSGGSVWAALSSAEALEAKPTVMLVVKAFRELDVAALEKAADKWTDKHTAYLVQWCHECITKQWRLFNDDESGIEGRSIPMKILIASYADVRPRLLIRANLMSALRGLLA